MSLGLVAYCASSDEDSDNEEMTSPTTSAIIVQANGKTNAYPQTGGKQNNSNQLMEEEDDEFLHKKVAQDWIEKPKVVKKADGRTKVQITIPSLSSFDSDVKDGEMRPLKQPKSKGSGLIGMLPPPKSGITIELVDMDTPSEAPAKVKSTVSLVPDSVRNRKVANPKPPEKTKTSNMANDDADDEPMDEDSTIDFFSLNESNAQPEINSSEINELVQRRAAKMRSSSALNLPAPVHTTNTVPELNEINAATASSSRTSAVDDDIRALCGVHAAKKARKGDIQFIDISQDQLTNKEEWLAHSLQAETEYQPRGLLKEPAGGTKKKHQITYLAHQAKANELELQAMWATNRAVRQQTQNKYGF